MGDEAHATTPTESFLDMAHLSISLRDEFDDDGRDDYYDSNDNEGGVTLTSSKNRSFTLSCASINFFGDDANIDSCSSDDKDGYSSGTF